jgi:flagellar L-ring protein precursor FlgH
MKGYLCTLALGTVLLSTPIAAQTLLYEVVRSPFAANIARHPGDLLTVKIEESAITSDSGSTNVNKKYDTFKFLLSKIFFPSFQMNQGFTETITGGTEPGFDVSAEKKYTANADRASAQKAQTNLEVRIVEVINRDQFLIRGQRTMKLNGKNTKVFVSGVIREQDIDSSNSISSTLIADATIEINGQVLGEDLEPGLIEKVLGLVL